MQEKLRKTYVVHKLSSPAEHLDLLSCCRQRKEERQVSGKAPKTT